ncbi:MAG: hypothetical protein V4550_15820 [Gemmatimonadota bacterium]
MPELSVYRGAVYWMISDYGYQTLNEPGDADNDIRFQCTAKSGRSYRSQFLLYPIQRIARVVIHFDLRYHPNRRLFFAEVVHRLNDSVAVLGHFEFHWDSGQTSFVFGAEVTDPDPETFATMMNRCAYAIEVWEAASGFFSGRLGADGVVSVAQMLTEV